MIRIEATKALRALLDEHKLNDWHIRLSSDIRGPLGLCSYKDKCIILNAHHVDTHPDIEITMTIRHEVAHALCPGQGHNDVWANKARELGCDNTLPCASYNISNEAVDAIRSGADLIVSFEEQVIRTPKYTVQKLQDVCSECGKIAKEIGVSELKLPKKRVKVTRLECGHTRIVDCDSQSPFEDLVFDADASCEHIWGTGKDRTKCTKCTAKRLYEYQIEGARSIERANGNFALLDEQGLGKTIQFLAYLKYNKDAFPYLWVTKSGIKYQHAREIIRVLGNEYMPQVITSGRMKLFPGVKGYLMSWDMFRRVPDLSMFANIQSMFLDECQAMKNPDSARTQSIRKVAKLIPRKVPASGTFWKNRGSEAFVMLNMLAPSRFYSFDGFKKRHVRYYDDANGVEKEGGLKPGFIDDIRDIAIRRERKDVMPELPLINRVRLTCELPEHARKVYEEEEDKYLNIYNQLVIGGEEGSFTGKAAMQHSLIIMRQIVGLAKVDTTVEFAKEFLEETDRKLVIFVHHIECGRLIAMQMKEFCLENNIQEPLTLSSTNSSEERFAIQNAFNGPNHRVMIASTLASGEGLNLQSCSDCIMHERQWNPANEEQAEGRFIRIGQEAQSVTATYVHGADTCDTDLDGIVEGKRVRFHTSMNKGEMPSWVEQDIMAELAERIKARRKK